MRAMFLKNRRGFTLTELIIVMAIFVVIILISSNAFKTIIDKSSQQSKSVETQIEGIVGLEVLRADLEQAGFGLPWTFSTTVSYEEAVSTGNSYNDAPGNPPRAILSGASGFNTYSGSSQYLVIKSTLAATNDTSKKWTTVAFDKDNVKSIRVWGAGDRDFNSSDRVIAVKDSLMSTPPSRQLMAPSSTFFSSTFGTYSTLTLPHQNGDTFEIYGIDPDTDVRMPFNRADFYVDRPDKMPATCSANSGILYKATINQSDGKRSAGMPLLDCVADMQVVYGLDNDGTGRVNQHLSAPANTLSVTAADIRSQLREVRVYILAQEGKKDLSYNYPAESIRVGEIINGVSWGRSFNLRKIIGTDYKYYRWKVYTIVVRPKNLVQ